MSNQKNEMTVREMRNFLFTIQNQGLEVKELRALLFTEEDQGAVVTPKMINDAEASDRF